MLNINLFLSVIDNVDYEIKFTRIYEKLEKKAFNIAYKITNDIGDAEEAEQDGFFRFAKNIGNLDFDDDIKIEIYVLKAIKNAALNIAKKRSKIPPTFDIDNYFSLSDDEDIESEIECLERVKKIKEIIKILPTVYRDVLSYYYLGNFKAQEISVFTGRSIATVKNQLFRGKNLLQKMIREANIYE